MSGERAFMDIGDFYGGPMNMVTPLLREYPISVVYYLFSLQSVVYELVFWIIYMYDVHCTYFLKIPFLYFFVSAHFHPTFCFIVKKLYYFKKKLSFPVILSLLIIIFSTPILF